MLDYDNIYNNFYENGKEPHPDFFIRWDETVRKNTPPGYYEPEEMTEIIDIYLSDDDIINARQAISHALVLHTNNEDMRYEICLLLHDYEQWNDLLTLCERYKQTADEWGNGYLLTALLHLGMEENAFHLFGTLKIKYAGNNSALNIVYQAMSEALIQTDLFVSAIEVSNEAIGIMGETIDFLWLQLHAVTAMENKEEAIKRADKIKKLNPLDAATWHHLGEIFQDLNDMERAIEAFENACALEQNSPNFVLSLMQAYKKNENYEKVLETARELIRLQPNNFEAYTATATICARLGKWDDAMAYIDEALRIMPEMMVLYLLKSTFFISMKELKKAKLTLEEGIEKADDPKGDLLQHLVLLNERFPDI
jgi:tetratricopeptide (TPR) repeat protein